MTQTVGRFGDFFYEIPEPEIFSLPCGGSVSSECVINSLGMSYAIEVIPRQEMIEQLVQAKMHPDIALGLRIDEMAGTGLARISVEANPLRDIELGTIDADSLPETKQVAA